MAKADIEELRRALLNMGLFEDLESAGLVQAKPGSSSSDGFDRGWVITPRGADGLLALYGLAIATAEQGPNDPLPPEVQYDVSHGLRGALDLRPFLSQAWPHYPGLTP